MPILEVVENGTKRVVRFTDTIVIGREPTNGVVIQDPMSSRRHCQLKREGSRFFLEDLDSSNGTLLNGRRASRVELAEGDRIEIGEVAVSFRLAEDREPVAATRAASPEPAAVSILEEPEGAGASTPDREGVSLRVVGSDGPTRNLDAANLPFTIGRKAECDLVLNDRRVSGLHAQVVRDGSSWVIEDCGSGNGVVVDKKRVKRHALFAGQSVLVGSTYLEFIGLPEGGASAPVQTAPRAKATATRPSGGVRKTEAVTDQEFRRIDVQQAQAASPLQAVWTVLFLVCFVAILFSGYVLVSNHFNQGRVAADPANLISQNPSFEDVTATGSVPGWLLDPAGDSGVIESFQAQGLPHGRRALRLRSTGSQRGFVRVLQESTLALSQVEGGVQISGSLSNEGFTLAGLELLWYVQKTNGLELVAETFAPLVSVASSFRTTSEVMFPPTLDVDVCRVGIFALGQGECTVDGVSLKTVVSDAKLDEEVRLYTEGTDGLTLEYDRRGTSHLTRRRSLIVRNLRFAALNERLPFGQLTSTKSEPPSRDDTGLVTCNFSFLASGPGSHVVVDHRAEVRDSRRLQLSWRVVEAAASAAPALILELETRASQQPSTLFAGDSEVLERGALTDLTGRSGTDWSLGEGSEQVCFSFSSEVEFRVLPAEQTRGVPTVAILVGSTRDAPLILQIGTTSLREERQIEAWFEEVRVACDERRTSAALKRLENIESTFPWREDARARVARIRLDIERRSSEQVRELEAMLAELRKHPGSPIVGLLHERAEALRDEFVDSPIAASAERILAEVTRLAADSAASARDEEAVRLLALGQQNFDGRRDEWARFYLERVVEMFADTEEARTAKNLLDRIAVRN